jgi:hypothetical protein
VPSLAVSDISAMPYLFVAGTMVASTFEAVTLNVTVLTRPVLEKTWKP